MNPELFAAHLANIAYLNTQGWVIHYRQDETGEWVACWEKVS